MDFYRAPTQISEVLLNVIGESHKRFCTIGDLAASEVKRGCVFTNFLNTFCIFFGSKAFFADFGHNLNIFPANQLVV